MTLAAYLHGAPGRLPFVGHFRIALQGDGCALAVAGSVAQRADVATAFRAARTIESVIRGLLLDPQTDHGTHITTAWTALTAIATSDLGPSAGGDLSILLTATDGECVGIAGMGLGGVWSWSSDTLTPLVTGDHPLLSGPGMPARLPGVLTLDERTSAVVAIPHDHPVPTLTINTLTDDCGIHR
jgi:hypothetical protein